MPLTAFGELSAGITLKDGRAQKWTSNRQRDLLARRLASEKTPRSLGIDPSGQFLYIAGESSGKLATYRVLAVEVRKE